MSSFTDPLDVRQIDGRMWQTLRPFSYWTGCANTEEPMFIRCKTCFIVPDGFQTDFASIPALAWPLIGHPAGIYAQAAVLHDYLYNTRLVSRVEADKIFVEAMKVLGVPAWKRWAMWIAVRAAGGFFYANRA